MSNRVKSEMSELSGFHRKTRIDLGLAIARWHAVKGEPMSQEVLAEFCGCTDSMIHLIEKAALRKLRRVMSRETDGALIRELLAETLQARKPATKSHEH